jgi:hypothetical protein
MDLILYLEELIMSIMGGSGYTLNDYVPVVPDGECRHTDRSSIPKLLRFKSWIYRLVARSIRRTHR